MRMESDLIARKINLLTVFFPALAPSYKEIILNAFDQYSLLKAYVRRIMDCYPGIQAEDYAGRVHVWLECSCRRSRLL